MNCRDHHDRVKSPDTSGTWSSARYFTTARPSGGVQTASAEARASTSLETGTCSPSPLGNSPFVFHRFKKGNLPERYIEEVVSGSTSSCVVCSYSVCIRGVFRHLKKETGGPSDSPGTRQATDRYGIETCRVVSWLVGSTFQEGCGIGPSKPNDQVLLVFSIIIHFLQATAARRQARHLSLSTSTDTGSFTCQKKSRT